MIRFITRVDMNETGSTGIILVQSHGLLLTTGMSGVLTQIPLQMNVHTDTLGGDVRQSNIVSMRISRHCRIIQSDKIYGISIIRDTPFAVFVDVYAIGSDQFDLS